MLLEYLKIKTLNVYNIPYSFSKISNSNLYILACVGFDMYTNVAMQSKNVINMQWQLSLVHYYNINSECSQPQCSSFSIDLNMSNAIGGSQQMDSPAEPPRLQVPQWNPTPVKQRPQDNRYSVFLQLRLQFYVINFMRNSPSCSKTTYDIALSMLGGLDSFLWVTSLTFLPP